jgi:thioesterase domain-containing protein/acyl carrier protein
MLCGGDRLAQDLAAALLQRGAALWNMYGPTETTIWSSLAPIATAEAAASIGRPVANTRFYVLDSLGQPVPIGVAGELHIGGYGLARGYLNRPELTRERFVQDPFGASGSRLYKTGDMVRYRPDGTLEFLGRMDHQVKIRGFRIELGEIESVLMSHPAVREAVAVVRNRGDERALAAYVVGENGATVDPERLRDYLQRRLPEYMVPAGVLLMDALPLTANGKIDRGRLAELAPRGAAPRKTPLRGHMERQMAQLWRKTLGIGAINAEDDFFDLGGHSLLAARLAAQIEKTFGRHIPLARFYEARTVRQMAAIVGQGGSSPSPSPLVAIRRDGSGPPLFLVHGAEGNVLLYRQLAESLGPDQPVFGLEAVGAIDPELRIEDLAARYVEAVRAVQPSGPYCLGGYCLGGVVAYEMSQQLLAQGERVAVLALLETYNEKAADRPLPPLASIYHPLQDVAYHVANLLAIQPREKTRFLFHKTRVVARRLQALAAHLISRLTGGRSGQPAVTRTMHRAVARYVPRPYPGTAILCRPKTHFAWLQDPRFGWGQLAEGGLTVKTLPVNPRGMLVEPFSAQLAEMLASAIGRAVKKENTVT